MFKKLNISVPILQSLQQKGYAVPTNIQEKAIPVILEGNDIFACAQTGTGKTAAFAIPVLQLLSNHEHSHKKGIRALILAPTRELAQQIYDSFVIYGKNLKLNSTVVFGGVSQFHQVTALRKKPEIVIATPGRLLDLMNQGIIRLDAIEMFVLDEADRMLDMGFINDIKKIISKIPAEKQTLLFTATATSEIKQLSKQLQRNPVYMEIAPEIKPLAIEQHIYYVDKINKVNLLCELLGKDELAHTLVFTRTKRGADRLAKDLSQRGIRSLAIHGDKSQRERQNNLTAFKAKKAKILVATDVASRGIDVKDLSHVINFDVPQDLETYTHRIGRTGRAGSSGVAITFCEPMDRGYIRQLTKLMGDKLQTIKDHPFVSKFAPSEEKQTQGFQKNFKRRSNSRSHSRSSRY